MALTLTEDEVMLVDSARGLLAREAPVTAFRALRDSGTMLAYEPALFADLANQGLIAPNVAEDYGGLGIGVAAAGLIAEQMGHVLAAAPVLSAAMAASLIGDAGSPDQKAELLPRLVAGDLVVACAFDETARHSLASLDSVATRDGDGWCVTGRKRAVIDGVGAGVFAVSAMVNGVSAVFLIEPNASGLTVQPIASVDSRNLTDLTFLNTPATRLGDTSVSGAIARAQDIGRALLAAELLGIADEAFSRTIAYLKEREQFGRKIGTFQALQHRAARLYARLDLARGVVLSALRAIDERDEEASMLASLAKAVMTKLSRDVLIDAVQMHGGIGVTDELDIGLFLKRARAAGELMGDDYFHTERLASEHWNI
jgi:alkylation response protein AidB-like acyl-CoA dehydrogenase